MVLSPSGVNALPLPRVATVIRFALCGRNFRPQSPGIVRGSGPIVRFSGYIRVYSGVLAGVLPRVAPVALESSWVSAPLAAVRQLRGFFFSPVFFPRSWAAGGGWCVAGGGGECRGGFGGHGLAEAGRRTLRRGSPWGGLTNAKFRALLTLVNSGGRARRPG
jgi:hypothetical protein